MGIEAPRQNPKNWNYPIEERGSIKFKNFFNLVNFLTYFSETTGMQRTACHRVCYVEKWGKETENHYLFVSVVSVNIFHFIDCKI